MPETPRKPPGAPSEFDCFIYPLPFPRRPIFPASMGSAESDWGCTNIIDLHSESVEPRGNGEYARCNCGVRFCPDLQILKGAARGHVVEWMRVEVARKTFVGKFDNDESAARAVDVARKPVECKKELLPNLFCEALTSYSETIPKNWGHQSNFKEFVDQRLKAQEYAANFCPNEIIARTDDKREDFHVSILPQIVMDTLEEITAESSSCFERNSSRKRKRKRSRSATSQGFAQDDDLFTKIASLIKQQIEDALSSTLLPLISVLRSREEDEQKHREQMLALEEQKLALKREKLLFERRRRVKHSRSSVRLQQTGTFAIH